MKLQMKVDHLDEVQRRAGGYMTHFRMVGHCPDHPEMTITIAMYGVTPDRCPRKVGDEVELHLVDSIMGSSDTDAHGQEEAQEEDQERLLNPDIPRLVPFDPAELDDVVPRGPEEGGPSVPFTRVVAHHKEDVTVSPEMKRMMTEGSQKVSSSDEDDEPTNPGTPDSLRS